MTGLYVFCVAAAVLVHSTTALAAETTVTVQEEENCLTLSNERVAINFDFAKHSYSISDLRTGDVVLADAWMAADFWGRGANKWNGWNFSRTWEPVDDTTGKGIRVVVAMEHPVRPASPVYLFSYTLHEGDRAVVMGFGMRNNRDYAVRLLMPEPMIGAKLLPGKKLESVQTLNGSAGAEPTRVTEGASRGSPNSLMLTGLVDGKRRTVVWGGLGNKEFGKYAAVQDGVLEIKAQDPVGRLVDPGQTYWAEDTFYLDVATADPFASLERYGRAMRTANHADPKVYDFPVLCGWGVGALCGLGNVNNTKMLVDQMEDARKSGLTRYMKVGIQLVPDTYYNADGGNTEQGWWDDEHWRKYGHLAPPYETFEKWGAALKQRDGIPCMYIQSGMPSDDYARAFPGHMTFNDISRLAIPHRHHQPLVSFDYTDPDFQKHMLKRWRHLRKAGVRSVMFDYPETAWRPEGGFANSHATTAFAYREMFRLAREGLGPEAYLDERLLGESGRPCLDVTAGIVDIQRTWGDSKDYECGMVTINGLRWYKNRTVFNYYPDTKTVHDLSKTVRQSMLTMLFLTCGRLNLASAFGLYTPEIVHDVSRIYPVYHEPFAARPLDLFTGVTDPQIYDLELTPDWRQVALFNTGKEAGTVSVALSGDRVATGAIGLEPDASYYVYDFWGDALVGKLPGSGNVERQLPPLGCAMLSIRKVQDNPQVLSTNRHVLQGWVDLADVKWDASAKQLTGVAQVIGGEPFRIVLAGNGLKPLKALAVGAQARLEPHPAGEDFAVLVLERAENGQSAWRVDYE